MQSYFGENYEVSVKFLNKLQEFQKVLFRPFPTRSTSLFPVPSSFLIHEGWIIHKKYIEKDSYLYVPLIPEELSKKIGEEITSSVNEEKGELITPEYFTPLLL